MLIKLENGDWVDPTKVIAVKAYPAEFGDEPFRLISNARIRVVFESQAIESFYDADDGARKAADRIAGQINDALQDARP